MKSYNKKRIISEGLFAVLFIIVLLGARGKEDIINVAIIGLIISFVISGWYIFKEAKRKKVTQ
ncbi:MAG: hypothetical protein Q4B63_05935 [Clostridium perfringens]|nr:hypothetical protein [Clostridium perfringens]